MSDMKRLRDVMARLRDPESGCPWDLEQDFESISPFTIEEAYEVDEAIASGDPDALRDELGDLLFQVVFQARIAEERSLFDFDDVVEAIASKLVRRHPHVFADSEAPATRSAQTASWEDIKAAERAAAANGGGQGALDPFAGIPRHLPALARSAKVAGRLERVQSRPGPDARGDVARAIEQEREASDAMASLLEGAISGPDRARALSIVGRGLRAWVALARAAGVDPEQALRSADERIIREVREGSSGS